MAANIDTRKEPVHITLACGACVIVDSCDEHLVRARKWRYRAGATSKSGPYVTACTSVKQLYLHREIMAAERGQIIDHINRDRLDNRRSNLRFATQAENARNRIAHVIEGKASKYKGVSRFSGGGKWRALIRDGSKQIYLGQFDAEAAAAYAYDIASLQLHGDFGRRNFLPFC